MTNDPTDAEILDLWESFVGEPTEEIPLSNSDKLCFARAALRSWGQPSGAGEPVATVIKKGADRQWMSERLGHLPDGVYSLYLTPQPTQAAPPAGREPLTDAQAQELIELESWGPDAIGLNAQLLRTIRRTEAAHGIKGKEAGMPDLSTLTERGAKAWAGVDAQKLREDGTT